MYIEKDLVFYNEPLVNQNQILDFMADKLEKKNYVTKGFREAVKKREEEFPTGLKLKGMNIAIVHTEAIFSKTEKLVVIKPEQSVTFKNIEDLKPLEVNLVFGLILKDSQKHLEVLQRIGQLLQDNEIIQDIQEVNSQRELVSLMQQYFNEKEDNSL
ncbi:PTS sugar transporter subunit IIA [Irregularibacter muris]|uniref:PTS sugar transporter subunit IIA n=1 Tax=Irregularibacter muris TaxID=1796619 RepID=A0AAE3KZS7_9FIRM|nr:PTS sugar transporter subunit IIA [Irregularibacter muris]MCR1899101.1 PTS sugar transporter subunit IIA [Irregularibacter muris]